MGLGKTLQGITLLWTLLKQGITRDGGPVAKRALIVCPTSLVANWDDECIKWLNGKVRTMPICEANRADVISSMNRFLNYQGHDRAQVMIVSYETFRIHAERFDKPNSVVRLFLFSYGQLERYTDVVFCLQDLIICDEAHRLKNGDTLTNKALGSVPCLRRVMLSGTPMQNNLDEFYAMVNFCNPGLLGTSGEFYKKFEKPILDGREPDATDKQLALAQERNGELSELVNKFVLRRTNTILSKHLPPKVVEVVCCKLSPLQQMIYRHFLSEKAAKTIATGKSAMVLAAITGLKKLCNHPKLIHDMITATKTTNKGAAGFESCADFFGDGLYDSTSGRGLGRERAGGGLPDGWETHSGKFAVLARLLAILRKETKDRIVIISNYTQTLDLIQTLCTKNRYPICRLDGSTGISKRQKLVKKFNDPTEDCFVFLLSSKAGGCGINLIGGNRLVLFDPDWNPANDKQAAGEFILLSYVYLTFIYHSGD
jgi:DNA repair and recombination RAD54-like protein